METQKHAQRLTDVQLQQKMLHYKAEAKKYMGQVKRLETQYDVKKINEILEKYEEMRGKKNKFEKNYKEIYQKHEKIKLGFNKLEERNEHLERTLREVEKIKNELANEKKQWAQEKRDLIDEINFLKEKNIPKEDSQNSGDEANREEEPELSTKIKSDVINEKLESTQTEEYGDKKNSYEQFFQTFQTSKKSNSKKKDQK
ncbi:hypothetical protein ACM26V_09755 [Salipaludibacillus sp. HK11]|uniref:hypothetical protein n=1 Tax=Salipaludibacillus sp. HK11 TaxID=3394320 RepID=UPI0039FB8CDA